MMSDEAQPEEQFAELKRLADQFRVKAHLASMEAKDTWEEELKPRLQKLEKQLDDATKDSNIGEEISRLESRLRKMVEDLVD
jgi:hypothetical protein